MNESTNANWVLPTATPSTNGAGRSQGDVDEWRQLVSRTRQLAMSHGWTKAEVARRCGMPDGTFSQWYSGTYSGRLDTQNLRVLQWLDATEEMATMAGGVPRSPGYFETRTAKEIVETLLYAQTLPEMSIITLGAGMGKTFTCRHYCTTRPHAYHITMTPNTRTVHGMLVELATGLGITQQNPAKLHRAIGDKLQRNGRQTLLIIDEAQNLVDAAVDQLRSLLDINECGIALVGNEEIYGRLAGRRDKPAYAQIKRRIGRHMRRMTPYPEDITAQIDAWGIEELSARKFLTGIGHKPGALGQIDKTLKLASLLAAGRGEALSEKHIREAWSNRAVED